ncbi:MAG: DUF134 domain-containing protein [Epsilonproteobacteria bacterium]|nr:DUF134 domain-containing protein [Campylobacterota bacterium]
MPKRIRRRIRGNFKNVCFKPCGTQRQYLDTVYLNADELEAIRLMDYEGLYQEEAAKEMGVSRPTFSRIIKEARRKIADAIVNSKSLEIKNF